MKTVLITGGAGFIGSHIADACVQAGYRVVILDNLSHGTCDNLPSSIPPSSSGGGGGVFYHGDIRDESIVCEIREKESPLILIHCAASISVPYSIQHPEETFAVNADAVERLVAILKPLNIIFSSSGGALYGNASFLPIPEDAPITPLSPYGESKYQAEKILHAYHDRYPNTAVTILRYANVYGERQPAQGGGVIAVLCDKLLTGAEFVINGNGAQTRDFIHVSDIVSATQKALHCERGIDWYNIGSGSEVSLKDSVDMLEGITEKRIPLKYGDSLHEVSRSVLDISKARAWGWQPRVSLEEGLKRTWEWWVRDANMNDANDTHI